MFLHQVEVQALRDLQADHRPVARVQDLQVAARTRVIPCIPVRGLEVTQDQFLDALEVHRSWIGEESPGKA